MRAPSAQAQSEGRGGGGGQGKLRKVFLQPMRIQQCAESFADRSGRVRMFGGDRDLIYGPGSDED